MDTSARSNLDSPTSVGPRSPKLKADVTNASHNGAQCPTGTIPDDCNVSNCPSFGEFTLFVTFSGAATGDGSPGDEECNRYGPSAATPLSSKVLRAFYLDFLAKQYRWPRVRMKIRPSAIAGVAAAVSFNSFFSSTFSLGPFCNTTIVPFSPCT